MNNKFYHVTLMKNIPSIIENGLVPQIGERSAEFGEIEPSIYLFSSQEDVDNALSNWLGDWYNDNYGEECSLAIVHISLPTDILAYQSEAEFEWFCKTIIPPEYLSFYDESKNKILNVNPLIIEENSKMGKQDKMPNMTEWRKKRYAQFNAKIDAFRDHPKYEWLRKYANDAMVWNEGFGFLMVKGEDFIKRIESMDVAFIQDWLDGKNGLKWDEYQSWQEERKAQNQSSSLFNQIQSAENLVQECSAPSAGNTKNMECSR